MSARLIHTRVQSDISGSREGPYYCSSHSEGRAHSPDSWCTSDRVECRLEPRPCPQPDTATSADNSIHTVTQSANQSTNHPINKSVNQSISEMLLWTIYWAATHKQLQSLKWTTMTSTAKHASIDLLLDHTHTHGPLSGTTQVTGTRKVKPIWILLEQETVGGSGVSWAICNSTPRSRQITMPAPHHSVFYRPDALPAAQTNSVKALKAYWTNDDK